MLISNVKAKQTSIELFPNKLKIKMMAILASLSYAFLDLSCFGHSIFSQSN